MDAKLFQLLAKSLKQASAISRGKGPEGHAFKKDEIKKILTADSTDRTKSKPNLKEASAPKKVPAIQNKIKVPAPTKKQAANLFDHPSTLDAKFIRELTGLSQSEFALVMNVSVKTLQNWEQHRREPTGPAASLLKIVSKSPEVALQALHG